MSTLVFQSHTRPLPYGWLQRCIDSVALWSERNGFEYRFIGDELFDCLPKHLREKTAKQRVIATDLARLKMLQYFLSREFDVVVWCDADFLVFDPVSFSLPETPYALGREVWVQPKGPKPGGWSTHVKVHNAFLMFRRGNAFLDFYSETAERLLELNTGRMPPQFIGPKLLTALHNIAQCHVAENAGMLSPWVVRDIANGGGEALDRFRQHLSEAPAAANLCASSVARGEVSEATMNLTISCLLNSNTLFH